MISKILLTEILHFNLRLVEIQASFQQKCDLNPLRFKVLQLSKI